MRYLLRTAAAAAIGLAACTTVPSLPEVERLSRLAPPVSPAENATTPAKVALGKQLFFDRRLSPDGSASCESCHYRHLGWTDGQALSKRVDGVVNSRHTPTLYNVGYLQSWYWDGRATTLEGQVLAAWRGQMSGDPVKAAAALNAVPAYALQFQSVFAGPASGDTIAKALAAYLRTVNSGESAWDRFEKGDRNAVTQSAIDGQALFMGKGRCVICHTPPTYTGSAFFNIGLEAGKAKADPGRFNVTKDVADTSAFKTPTLRSVEISGPYFHDGSVASLEDAVRYMAKGGGADPAKSPVLVDTGLSDAEIISVVAFLRTLTSEEPFERPIVP